MSVDILYATAPACVNWANVPTAMAARCKRTQAGRWLGMDEAEDRRGPRPPPRHVPVRTAPQSGKRGVQKWVEGRPFAEVPSRPFGIYYPAQKKKKKGKKCHLRTFLSIPLQGSIHPYHPWGCPLPSSGRERRNQQVVENARSISRGVPAPRDLQRNPQTHHVLRRGQSLTCRRQLSL